VLVEAMACGVPVVGSDSGEIPHVIGEGGLVFPEGDVTALRECLARLAASPEERRRLGELGRARVLARYTHASIAASYAQVYRQVALENWPQRAPALFRHLLPGRGHQPLHPQLAAGAAGAAGARVHSLPG